MHHAINEYQLRLDVQDFLWPVYYINYAGPLSCILGCNNIDAHKIDGGKRSTQRGIHTLPHTRRVAGPVDYSGGVRAAEGLDGVSRSFWPGEELSGLCITEPSCCRYDKGGRVCV